MTPPNLSLLMIMACFWVTLWLVQRYLIGPLGAVLEERRGRIEGAEKKWAAKNEEHRSATARLESELEEAARSAAAVREEHCQRANQRRQEVLNQARAAAEEKLDRALGDLDREAEEARTELARHAAALSKALASRLLEREVAS